MPLLVANVKLPGEFPTEDALRSTGVRVLALPLSPDNIAALLRAARACKPPAPAVADD